MHAGACPKIDGPPSWNTLHQPTKNETLSPKPHHLIDICVLARLVSHDVFPVAREEAEFRTQNRPILLCETSFKNRINKSDRHMLLQAIHRHVISVDEEFQQRIDSVVLFWHPFAPEGWPEIHAEAWKYAQPFRTIGEGVLAPRQLARNVFHTLRISKNHRSQNGFGLGSNETHLHVLRTCAGGSVESRPVGCSGYQTSVPR